MGKKQLLALGSGGFFGGNSAKSSSNKQQQQQHQKVSGQKGSQQQRSDVEGDGAPAQKRQRTEGVKVVGVSGGGSLSSLDCSTVELNQAVTDDMLKVTIHTLKLLNNNVDLFRSSRFRDLRAVCYPLVNAPQGGQINRISDALLDQRYFDAKLALESLRKTNEVPKLGSVQRWVRELDLAGMDETQRDAMLTLDAILRTAASEQISTIPLPKVFLEEEKSTLPDVDGPPVVFRQEDWDPLGERPAPQAGTLDEERITDIAGKFSVLLREAAAERRPPNVYDMILYQAPPKAVPMRPAASLDGGEGTPVVKCHKCPDIPGSFYLENLLSAEEAATVVAVAEKVGMTPDEPQTGKSSILAHHFVWMADESFIGNVFDRCKKFLPKSVHGAPIVGLNGRLRCYRYKIGSVYRPHVDGAWPQSGIDPESGEYVYDISQGAVTSKFTFLMYLNDGFEGGQTKFYTPATEEGHLKSTAVKPRAGGCFVFPHADTSGCLVHEGSAVTAGAKYIIRTEVLYKVK